MKEEIVMLPEFEEAWRTSTYISGKMLAFNTLYSTIQLAFLNNIVSYRKKRYKSLLTKRICQKKKNKGTDEGSACCSGKARLDTIIAQIAK